MSKSIKLIILILISTSVYFIYQNTNNKTIKILTLGDILSIEKDSSCLNNCSYLNVCKDYLVSEGHDVTLNNNYLKKDLTLKEIIQELKYNPTLKRDLKEAHILFITLGYNDLVSKLSLEENLNDKTFNEIIYSLKTDYNEIIKEIRKYYKNDIVVIGYYPSFKNGKYLNKGIRRLNSILESNIEVEYIDTYSLLNNHKEYFKNNSYYPNIEGYKLIGNKIITEILAKKEKI